MLKNLKNLRQKKI